MIHAIHGPMFASKSKRLIQYLTGAMTRRIPHLALKPEQDDRTHSESIYSYDGSAFPATEIKAKSEWGQVKDLLESFIATSDTSRAHLLAIDEVQFLSQDTVEGLVQRYLRSSNWLILSGLIEDSEGDPFGALPPLLEEYPLRITQEVCTARCSFCHGEATKTHCKVPKDDQVLTGRDIYEPRCALCWRFGQVAGS